MLTLEIRFLMFFWQLYLFSCLKTLIKLSSSENVMFLPRDAMHKRGLCRHAMSVCLSVRLSRS